MAETSARTKVLTVGDGDLSLSLALSRAYGDHIDLTASVLEANSLEFQRVFPEAPLDELKSRGVAVLCGVDATQLHSRYILSRTINTKPWDLVSFHHPHLGISNLENYDEPSRASLHHRLLCHYLHSAKQISNLVHVCLTGTQPQTWKLFEAAKLQNLRLVQKLSDTKPFAHVWMDKESSEDDSEHQGLPEPAKIEAHFAAPRKYRNGKLGRHFLARYGYHHRRTEGVLFKGSTKDANVSESMHFVFASEGDDTNNCLADSQNNNTPGSNIPENKTSFVCPICKESFDSGSDLKVHLARPINISAIKGTTEPRLDPTSASENPPSRTEQNPSFKRPPAREAPTTTEVQQSYDESLGIILRVPSTNHGKRLRWFLQHTNINNLKFTKRLAETTIQAGLVSVKGQVAIDSSRILQDGDTVTIQKTKNGNANEGNNSKERNVFEIPKSASKTPTIEIVQRSHSQCPTQWLVVLKPSGMRTKGNFPGTLEYTVSEQTDAQYWCLSSLETSCSGLCLLIPAHKSEAKPSGSSFSDDKAFIEVQHNMTVLVNGPLTKTMMPLALPVHLASEAKWRNKKRKHALQQESISESQPEKDAVKRINAQVWLKEFFVTAESDNKSESEGNVTGLSTMEVLTSEPSSGSICHFFRQRGHPVVGDSFCKQEYSKLKRSIRNRIKNKLCIGCYRVEISGNERGANAWNQCVELPPPDKLSATYWEKFLSNESTK